MSQGEVRNLFKHEIMPLLAPAVRRLFSRVEPQHLLKVEEIRMRSGQPLIIRGWDGEYGLDANNGLTHDINRSYRVSGEDIIRTIAAISDNSLYAFEEDIKKGFITIAGGHRVGLAGQVIMQQGQVKAIKEFSSICLRIAREIKGCAVPLMGSIYAPGGKVNNTLLISPPRCGKTTLLRDIARLLSTGSRQHQPYHVVIVDERSELAGCYLGLPQLEVGPRTDVLDACSKAAGIMMAIRALSPEVIITDELGRREDAEAIRECINAGVSIVSSVHASSVDELAARPIMSELVESKIFKNIIILSRSKGPGSIEKVIMWE